MDIPSYPDGLTEELRRVVAASLDGCLMLNRNGVILDVNKVYCDISGYSRPALLAMNLADLEMTDDSHKRLQSLIGSSAQSSETIHRCKDGSIVSLKVSLTSFQHDGENLLAFVRETGCRTAGRDAAELKALTEIARLNRLYAVLSHVNLLLSKARSPEELFEEVCRITVERGNFLLSWIGVENPLDSSITLLSHAGAAQEYARNLVIYADQRPEGLGPTGRSIREQRTIVSNDFSSDPTTEPWRLRAEQAGIRSAASFPIMLNNKLFGIFTTYASEAGVFQEKEIALLEEVVMSISFGLKHLQEETKRLNAEQKLQTSEERFRTILSLSPDIISVLDKNGRLLFNSPNAHVIHGYTDQEMQNQYTFDLMHPDDQPQVAGIFKTLLKTPDKIFTVQYRYRNKDDSYTWMEANAINQLNNPLIRGIVAISRNITDRKKAEQQRLDLERNLLHTQKLESLGVLSGGIAHDFNNLLAAIVGNLELALLQLSDSTQVRTKIERSILASQRAAELTRQMLEYCGKGMFNPRPVNLGEIVTENSELFRTVIPNNVRLIISIAKDLPQIMADPAQMQQVVMNLITNAAEAIGSEAGVVTLISGMSYCDDACVSQSCIEEKPAPGRFLYIEVSDNGCGMNQETKQRLFEPFFTTKFTGRGLRMAATQGIVKSHGGMILLESEEGFGTTFRILFPLAAEIQQLQHN